MNKFAMFFLGILPLCWAQWGWTPSTIGNEGPGSGTNGVKTSPETSFGGENKSKMGGVSVVSPPGRVTDSWVDPVRRINADWVAVMPYAFSQASSPQVQYNLSRQWWGERMEGMTEIVRHAKGKGLKVMLKPMVWVSGSWPGGYEMDSEENWKLWEASYAKYILETARIAQNEHVDLFCIGTEFKIAVVQRAEFWKQLIVQVRKIYTGPITYAANWDEFMKVPFWQNLDYIGVDAYFPLSPEETPDVKMLKRLWAGPAKDIELLHKIYRKPVIFTEFGYRSTHACTWRQWEIQNIPYNQKVNLQSQVNAYQAFFESFWDKEWFAGVFLWQWYTNHATAGGVKNSDYTPQNKPAEKVIAEWFARNGAGQP